MEELFQPSLNGRGGPISLIAIQATNFGLKNDMIQQVQNSCQIHGLPGDDANKHFDKFLHVTQSIKVNGVTDDALCLYLFPRSLTRHATTWFDRLPGNSINTFEQMAKMFLGKYFPPSMVMMLRNEITNFRQRPDESLFEAWERVDYVVDPRVPIILERPFLRTIRALIDVYEIPKSGNPTPTTEPIIASSSPSFTPFEGSDFILEEIKTFLRTSDELLNLDDDYYDTEEPLELELKELPSYLEYAFLEGTDKLPVIISKELKDEEKSALLKVLKSHKWAIAWKISDIRV
nr:reverse transcriptase domain-containing protein [Tanacetum cinerariifolium]